MKVLEIRMKVCGADSPSVLVDNSKYYDFITPLIDELENNDMIQIRCLEVDNDYYKKLPEFEGF